MSLNWFESILYGLLSGLTDILPVSAEAHRILMLKIFGAKGDSSLIDLFVHLGILAALYYSCQKQIVRMTRAQSLKRVPKRKRKRPLDTWSLMDISLLRTMLIPVILSLFVYEKAAALGNNLIWLSVFLFLNGIVLYIPRFLPTGNRDSRTLSRVEGLLMGLGGALSVLPGISAIGAATSVGSVCGVDHSYNLNMALLMNLVLNAGMVILDVLGIISVGLTGLSFSLILHCIVIAVLAFGGSILGIRIMRALAANGGFTLFGFYCLGQSLFTFILNLMA